MRRWGPLLLIVVAALLGSAAWYVLRSGPASPIAGAAHPRGGADGGATDDPASAAAPDGPDRVAVAADAALPPAGTGPNSVRGQVRYAADQRPASGARVRAFRNPPPLRSRKLTQAMQRDTPVHPPAAEQDLSAFESPPNGDGNGKDDEDDERKDQGKSGDSAENPAAPADENAPVAVAITKRDGSFEIAGLENGTFHLDAVTADAVSAGTERVDFEAGPVREGVVLQLVVGARVRGRVHDEEGKPIAKATVSLGAGFDPFSVFSAGGMELSDPAKVRTDASGAFLFDPIVAPRTLQVRAAADDFAPSPPQKLDLQPGDERTVDLLLAHGATVLVHVTDSAGAPIAGARCRLEPTKLNLNDMTGDRGTLGRRTTKSDADGRARFASVASGDWRVRASAEGRLADSKTIHSGGPGTEQSVEFSLANGRSLTGVVVARDGTPVADARVTAFVEPSLMKMSTLTAAAEARPVKCDEQGHFTLGGLPTGKLLCEANAKGYRAERKTVDADATDIRFELPTPGAIEGVVVSRKTGKPVARFDFHVAREHKSTSFMDPELSKNYVDVTVPIATANGKFRLVGVAPGRVRLVVRAAEHGEYATDWLEVVEGETKRGVVIFLEAEAIVEGVVVDAAGAPIAGAGVRREVDANPLEKMMKGIYSGDDAQSDVDGKFRIGGLAAGVLRLVASKDGYLDAGSGDLDLAAGQRLDTLRIELARGGEIWGVVADPTGAPIAGATLMCQETARMKIRSQKSDVRGEFHFKGLPAGSFAVAKLPGDLDLSNENFVAEMTGSTETRNVRLKTGETQRVDFTGLKSGGAAVEGRVTQGGTGVGGLLVTAFSNPSGIASAADASTTMRTGTTDEEGRYHLADVPAGNGYVEVKGEDVATNGGGSAALRPVQFVDGQTARVDLEIPTGGVRGTVVDAASGAPLAGIAVYAASSDPGASVVELATRRAAAVHSDTNGAFSLPHLRSGRYVVTAGATDLMATSPAGHSVVRSAPLDVKEGLTTDAGTIRLPTGGRVEGTLVDGDGKGISGASVFLRGGDGEFLEEWTATTSDATGRFAYGGVPAGTWDAVARAPGRATAVAHGVGVSDGEVATVRLVLIGGTEVFADIGDVAVERLYSLKVEVDGPDGRIPLTLFGLGDLTDLLAHPPRPDVVRLGRFGPGDYRVSGTIEGKSFERRFTLKGEPELHVPVDLPR